MKIKIKPGEKVTIELARKTAPSSRSKVQSQPETPKGLIRPPREQEYLARRRKPEPGIELYDLGVRLVSGQETDFFFQTHSGLTSQGAQTEITAAPFDQMLAEFLEIGVENFTKEFLRIERENCNRYGIRIFAPGLSSGHTLKNDSFLWNEAGNKITFPEDVVFTDWITWQNSAIFSSFRTDQPIYKITAEPQFSSDETAFSPGPNDKWFFLPAFCVVEVFASATLTDSPVSGWDAVGNAMLQSIRGDYQTFPRIALLDHALRYADNSFSISRDSRFGSYPLDYAAFSAHTLRARALQNSRHFRTFQGKISGGNVEQTDELAPALFPDARFFTVPGAPAGASAEGESVDFRTQFNWARAPGAIIAVIKQGANYFYLWYRG